MDLLTKENAEIIGRKLGRVVVVVEDLGSKIRFGRGFLRMKIGMRIEKELINGFWIPRKNKGKV